METFTYSQASVGPPMFDPETKFGRNPTLFLLECKPLEDYCHPYVT